MSLLPAPSPTISVPVLRARLAARGLGNASNPKTLAEDDGGAEQYRSGRDRRRDASQSGTARPQRNDRLPASAFVAQVIGQATAQPPARASALAQTAYRRAGFAPGLLFDAGI